MARFFIRSRARSLYQMWSNHKSDCHRFAAHTENPYEHFFVMITSRWHLWPIREKHQQMSIFRAICSPVLADWIWCHRNTVLCGCLSNAFTIRLLNSTQLHFIRRTTIHWQLVFGSRLHSAAISNNYSNMINNVITERATEFHHNKDTVKEINNF